MTEDPVGKPWVALVTGGAKGIGLHISLRLAKAGIRVALLGRDDQALLTAARQIREAGGNVLTQVCDVTSPGDVDSAIHQIEDTLGFIDIAICNAGITGPTALCENISIDDWNKTLATNLSGVFYTCRAVLPNMKIIGRGRIILIGSTTSKRPVANRIPYAASKMGIIGFGRSLASEVGQHGITVNTICPGVVEGERWDLVAEKFAAAQGVSKGEIESHYKQETLLRRFVMPQEVAELVYFLVSVQGESITGQDINICAGLITY